jgi:hypothetical protein
MNKLLPSFYLIFILLVFFTIQISCKKDASISPISVNNKNYFPLEKGRYWIYKVDSFYYNDFTSSIDTFSFELKEYIESEIKDDKGNTSYRLERYYRNNSTENWQLKRVWLASFSQNSALKTEENIRYLKLLFPIKQNLKWNGNAYNTLGEQNFEYTDIHKKTSLGTLDFDSVCTILQIADTSLISIEYHSEQYAANVGLIKKRKMSLQDTRSTIQTSIPIVERANKGTDVIYTIISYGK